MQSEVDPGLYISGELTVPAGPFSEDKANMVTEPAAFAPSQQPMLTSVSMNDWNPELEKPTQPRAYHKTARIESFRATA